jgi:hypothetical protein
VVDDGPGNVTVFEGEAEDENAIIDFGRLEVLERPYPGEPQNSPSDRSIPLSTLFTPNPKMTLEQEKARIEAIPDLLYSPLGPNSNTVAHDLVRAVGVDMGPPDWRLFGWNSSLQRPFGFPDNPFLTD